MSLELLKYVLLIVNIYFILFYNKPTDIVRKCLEALLKILKRKHKQDTLKTPRSSLPEDIISQ